MLYITGVDPGQTTGFCWLTINNDSSYTTETKQYQGVRDIGDFFRNRADWIHYSEDSQFVIANERFTITPKSPNSPWSLEVTGVLKYWADALHIEYKDFTPSQTKRLITNDVLHRAGMWTIGEDHARDASRVALYYAITQRKLLTHLVDPS